MQEFCYNLKIQFYLKYRSPILHFPKLPLMDCTMGLKLMFDKNVFNPSYLELSIQKSYNRNNETTCFKNFTKFNP